MKHTLTHKGWFGICPVFLAGLDSEAPLVLERHWALTPLMMFSEFVYGLCFTAIATMGKEPPGWPLLITAELSPPRVFVTPDDPA